MKDVADSPTAKVLRTLAAIQDHPGVTAGELSRLLDVSDRAVRRYITTLRNADIPIDAERGRDGGYRVGRSLRPPPLQLNASEALGLVMAAPDRRAARPDPAIMAAVVETVANRRGAFVDDTTGSGTTLESRVDPWAIVVRHGRWYLLCVARGESPARALRIDRINRLDPLNVDVEPPAVNPVEWLETHLASSWDYTTLVEFDAPFGDVEPWIRRPLGSLQPIDGGSRCRLRGTTRNPTMYAGEWLAGIPFPFRVIGGPELQRAVAEVANRLLAAAGPPARDAQLL